MPIKIETSNTVRQFNGLVQSIDIQTDGVTDRLSPAEIYKLLLWSNNGSKECRNFLRLFLQTALQLGYPMPLPVQF